MSAGVGIIATLSPKGACPVVVQDAMTAAPLSMPTYTVGQLRPEGPPLVSAPGAADPFTEADVALGVGILFGAALLTKAFYALRRRHAS